MHMPRSLRMFSNAMAQVWLPIHGKPNPWFTHWYSMVKCPHCTGQAEHRCQAKRPWMRSAWWSKFILRRNGKRYFSQTFAMSIKKNRGAPSSITCRKYHGISGHIYKEIDVYPTCAFFIDKATGLQCYVDLSPHFRKTLAKLLPNSVP